MTKLAASIAFLSASVAFAAQGHAADFYATDTADSYVQSDGWCSLREAIDTANYNDCWDDCGCGDPQDHVSRDIVHLAPGAYYQLDNWLEIWDSVEIDGAGAVIYAGDGGGDFQGLQVSGDAYDVVLHDFWLTNFRHDALVADTNSVVLTDGLVVYQNRFSIGSGQNASVLAQPWSYVVLDNFVSAYNTEAIKGGGLFVGTDATVELRNSLVVGNRASQYGGGAHVQGTLWCTDSSINENTAERYVGGGVYVYTPTGHLYMSNCDVSGNTAPTDPNIHQ